MGLGVEWLDAAGCRELEPRLNEHVLGGVFSTAEATVSNQLIALAFERGALALGCEIEQGAPATRFNRKGDRVKAAIAGGTAYEADLFVLAAGARSGQIGKRMGIDVPVFPVRGQMIALGGMQTPVRHVVWGPDGYLVPRANGLVFAGATVEMVGFRRRTTQAGVRAMRSMARRLIPQLAAAQVHFEWAGLRPATPDAYPIIGPAEGTNIVLATGHYRNGILLGPISAHWIARGIADGDWSAVPENFSPARFNEVHALTPNL
jgi:glycine oxidase